MKKGGSGSFDTEERCEPADGGNLVTLQLRVRPDLYRAYQRCSWIIIHETGRGQLDIMQEMVEDFLVKHGC
jgi:hypothetical protein